MSSPKPTRITRYLFCTFAFSLVTCIFVSYWNGMPLPRIHDEFSYCLAGETFALGRLTNETHPFADHFATMHVLQRPSYMSKYPPGQGLALALGHFLGHPMFGVWLTFSLAAAAITWCFSAICDAFWGMVVGSSFAFTMNVAEYEGMSQLGYWAQSYWGGSIACFGAALSFGSFLWLMRFTAGSISVSVTQEKLLMTAFVFGLWTMGISRPLEGFLASLPLGMGMLVLLRIRFQGQLLAMVLRKLAIPLFVAVMGLSWIAYYNQRITGSPFQLPYLAYESQHALTPMFLFQPLRENTQYSNEQMRSFHEDWEAAIFRRQQQWSGYWNEKREKLGMLWRFYVGWELAFPVLIGLFVSARALVRGSDKVLLAFSSIGLSVLVIVFSVHSQTVWMNPHYLAPLVPFLWCWIGLGFATMAKWTKFRFDWGLLLVLICIAWMSYSRLEKFDVIGIRIAATPWWHLGREKIVQQLESSGGKHLILIRYQPSHSVHEEWCYNSADIDGSNVIWARDLGAEKNAPLLQYFHDRKVHDVVVSAKNVVFTTRGEGKDD